MLAIEFACLPPCLPPSMANAAGKRVTFLGGGGGGGEGDLESGCRADMPARMRPMREGEEGGGRGGYTVNTENRIHICNRWIWRCACKECAVDRNLDLFLLAVVQI
jgi:hypothetical protein